MGALKWELKALSPHLLSPHVDFPDLVMGFSELIPDSFLEGSRTSLSSVWFAGYCRLGLFSSGLFRGSPDITSERGFA